MKGSNVQIAFVLLTSFLILIGYGHGVGPIVLLRLYTIVISFTRPSEIDLNHFVDNFSIIGSYDDVIPTVSIILLIGFIFLLTAIFLKKTRIKKLITITGITVMISGYLVLPLDEGLRVFSGVTGIPFLLISMKLLIQLITIKDMSQDIKKAS